MRFLLDTHVFIWAMEGSKKLSADIMIKISDPKNEIFISVATIWEIVLKRQAKKMKLAFNPVASIEKTGLKVIPIQIPHVLGIGELPLYHKDPFDRILIAQAIVENLTLVTSDEKIWKYKTSLIRA